MAIWNKLKTELDRAGRVAQSALDEGKLRLDAFRARQHADKAAQALGYAVYRARTSGNELDADTYGRLSNAIAEREAEAESLEARLSEMTAGRRGKADDTGAGAGAQEQATEPPPAAGGPDTTAGTARSGEQTPPPSAF